MATMNISLPDPMRGWVQAQIDTGQYSSSSDYVRDLIRKDQQRQGKVQNLQKAIEEGLASGTAKPFDKKAFKARMLKKRNNADL